MSSFSGGVDVVLRLDSIFGLYGRYKFMYLSSVVFGDGFVGVFGEI